MSDVNVKTLSEDELLAHRADLMRQYALSLFHLRTGQLQDTSRLPVLRRDIARANTELRSREVQMNAVKGVLLGRTVGKKVRGDAGSASAEGGRRSRFGLGPVRDAIVGGRAR